MLRFIIFLLCALFATNPVHADSDASQLGHAKAGSDKRVDIAPKTRSKSKSSTQNTNGPLIKDIRRLPEIAFPPPNTPVEIHFSVEEGDARVDAQSATVYYTVNGGMRQKLPATSLNGRKFSAVIPPQKDMSTVEYEIVVQDIDNNTGTTEGHKFGYFKVMDREPGIQDVREPFHEDGSSAYVGYPVTLEGTVSSVLLDKDNFQVRYFIQISSREYSGIQVSSVYESPADLAAEGDFIRISGIVAEVDGSTALVNAGRAEILGHTGFVAPVTVSIARLWNTQDNGQPGHERWENMLVQLNYVEVVENKQSGSTDTDGVVYVSKAGNPANILGVDLRHGTHRYNDVGGETQQYYEPREGKTFEQLNGVLIGSPNDVVRLVPRKDDDFGTLVSKADAPAAYEMMLSNYPNPFQGLTTISFNIESAGITTIKILDAQGRVVATPVSGYYQPGRHAAKFRSDALANGVYLMVLTAPDGAVLQHQVHITR